MKKVKLNNGVTLVELLIVVTISSILAVGFLSMQYVLSKNREVSIRNYYNIEESNGILSSIVRELRTAQAGEDGSYSIVTANDNEIVFYSDENFDGLSDKIRYTLIGTSLEKGVTYPTGQPYTYPSGEEKVKILTESILNSGLPIFTYYNGDYPADTSNNPLSTPATLSEVKLVNIHLEINRNDDEEPYILESFTQVRTLKENLGE